MDSRSLSLYSSNTYYSSLFISEWHKSPSFRVCAVNAHAENAQDFQTQAPFYNINISGHNKYP